MTLQSPSRTNHMLVKPIPIFLRLAPRRHRDDLLRHIGHRNFVRMLWRWLVSPAEVAHAPRVGRFFQVLGQAIPPPEPLAADTEVLEPPPLVILLFVRLHGFDVLREVRAVVRAEEDSSLVTLLVSLLVAPVLVLLLAVTATVGLVVGTMLQDVLLIVAPPPECLGTNPTHMLTILPEGVLLPVVLLTRGLGSKGFVTNSTVPLVAVVLTSVLEEVCPGRELRLATIAGMPLLLLGALASNPMDVDRKAALVYL